MDKKERGRIVTGGVGGFLNPPDHPEHSHSVETDLRRRPENRSSMALSSAVEAGWLDDETRRLARKMLEDWQANRPPLESASVQDWVHNVLGYYRGCYRGPGEEPECWHAGTLTIATDRDRVPMDHIDTHAGVHLIRTYYPEFVPTAEHFAAAYWGSKP